MMPIHRPARWFALFACTLLVPALVPGTVRADDEDPMVKTRAAVLKMEAELVKRVARVRRSSVSVLNYRKVKGRDGEPRIVLGGCGSGVLVSEASKKWILTNVHVIAGAAKLTVVVHTGEEIPVVMHDQIKSYDIALLKFPERPKSYSKLPAVRVKASSSEGNIKEGTWIIATGNPFFLATDGRPVTTWGVISGTGRVLGGKYAYVGAVQHDAEVNPGNSGGPLWDLKGRLIGLNGKIATRPSFRGARPTNTGASFALPAHQLDAFLKQLTRKGDASAGFFGVDTQTFMDTKGRPAGARVTAFKRGCPAALGRDALKVGDVITGFGSRSSVRRIETSTELQEMLSLMGAGTKVIVRYKRGRRSHTWKGVLGTKK